MKICAECGKSFDLEEAKQEYFEEFEGDPEYDEQFPEGDVCGDCATLITGNNIKAGQEAFG